MATADWRGCTEVEVFADMWPSSLLSCSPEALRQASLSPTTVPWPTRVPAGTGIDRRPPPRVGVIAEASVDRPLLHPTPLQKVLLDEGVACHELPGFRERAGLEGDQPSGPVREGPAQIVVRPEFAPARISASQRSLWSG